MVNSELSEISYIIQEGVTAYPIGFKYHFNENNSPQLLVKIGDSVAIINVDFELSKDELEVILIPTEEEAKAQTGPNDTRWMSRIVGKELLITRDIPFTQTSDYYVGRISPEQIEYDFDRTVMRDQEILHQLSDFTVDVALAESLANAAVETANEAAEAANNATAIANTALGTANTAVATSTDAKSTANKAIQDSSNAVAAAAQAANKADAADLTATTAMEIAAEAATLAQSVYSKKEVDDKITVINADIDANSDAIQKTRADFISADSEIHGILNNHASELTTLHNDVDEVGDQVSGIEEKIPGTASATNPLVTKQQLLDEEMDIREDLNSGLGELQTQITAQAAEIAKKQDELTAGENITIVDNVISSTGGGGLSKEEADLTYLPISGGRITGELTFGEKEPFISPVLFSKSNGTLNLFDRVTKVSGLSFTILGIECTLVSDETYLGSQTSPWGHVFTKKLNAGSEDLIVPTEGGTLARLEDLEGIGGGGASLPDQAGNAGKFLMTDGTGVSWGASYATTNQDSFGGVNYRINIGTVDGYTGTAASSSCVAIGTDRCGDNCISILGKAYYTGSVAIGYGSVAESFNGTAIGNNAKVYSSTTNKGAIAIGYGASVSYAKCAIQLGGNGGFTGYTNSDANTFKVGNANGNFEMMDANGNVPLERLTYVTGQIGDISTALTAILGE